jgi:hypothetical protein
VKGKKKDFSTLRGMETLALTFARGGGEGGGGLFSWLEHGDGDFKFVHHLHRLDNQQLLLLSIGVWALFLGCTALLYVWIASRQVRPRPLPPAPPSLPTSPTSKRKRHSKSFSDMQELEREMMAENAAMDRHDWSALPMSLQRKCTPEQCKMIYDTLSKVSGLAHFGMIVS